MVGGFVVAFVGSFVGAFIGTFVGAFIGAFVGAFIGAFVGAFGGATVVGVAEKIKTYISKNQGHPKNYLYDCNPNNPYKLPLPPPTSPTPI